MRSAKMLLLPVLAAGIVSAHASIDYPATRTTNQVDINHGVAEADPYRWLEDDNAPEAKAWVAAQNQVTLADLKKIPQHDAIRRRLKQFGDYRIETRAGHGAGKPTGKILDEAADKWAFLVQALHMN
jgi:prolyl oligopeptidase